jgi:hypothetical protein
MSKKFANLVFNVCAGLAWILIKKFFRMSRRCLLRLMMGSDGTRDGNWISTELFRLFRHSFGLLLCKMKTLGQDKNTMLVP